MVAPTIKAIQISIPATISLMAPPSDLRRLRHFVFEVN